MSSTSGLSPKAQAVVKEHEAIETDAKWLSDHKKDPDFMQQAATRAPQIQQDWRKFQGDSAALQLSEDPGDQLTALTQNADACDTFTKMADDMKFALGGVLNGPLTDKNSTALDIQHQFQLTIDCGNAALLHLKQQIQATPVMASVSNINHDGAMAALNLSRSPNSTAVEGGTIDANTVAQRARELPNPSKKS